MTIFLLTMEAVSFHIVIFGAVLSFAFSSYETLRRAYCWCSEELDNDQEEFDSGARVALDCNQEKLVEGEAHEREQHQRRRRDLHSTGYSRRKS